MKVDPSSPIADAVWHVLDDADVTSRFPTADQFRGWLGDPTRGCWTRIVDGRPVAVTAAHHLTENEHATLSERWKPVCPAGFPADPGDGYLTAAATVAAHRHLGYFTDLLDETIRWFESYGTHRVVTMCWQQPDHNSYHALVNAGFVTVADIPDYWDGYTDAATLMTHQKP